jgi:hypothetical protein
VTVRDRRLRLVDLPQRADEDAGHGVEVSADVVAAVGAATVMRLRADSGLLHDYRCPFCDRSPQGTATLIAFRYAHGLSVVRLAHASCSPSAVVRLLSAPTLAGHRVRAACWLRPLEGRGASAVLLVDNQVRAWPRHRARQARDGYARALEAAGFTPAVDLDGDPPAPCGLTITLTPAGDGATRVRVTHPSAVVHDGTVEAPDPWLRQAHRCRTVTVVTGTGILAGTPPRRAAGKSEGRWLLDGVTTSLAEGRAWTGAATLGTPPRECSGESQGASNRRRR